MTYNGRKEILERLSRDEEEVEKHEQPSELTVSN